LIIASQAIDKKLKVKAKKSVCVFIIYFFVIIILA